MRRVTVLVLAFALLMMFVAVAPVMADKPTVTAIKAVQVGAFMPPPGKVWTTGSGILQVRDFLNVGTVKLYVPDSSSVPTYVFKLNNLASLTRNSDNETAIIRVSAEWIYPVSGTTQGTFEGQIEWNYNGPHVAHGLLHGTGVFEGQKLSFWVDTTFVGNVTWVGTLSE